MAGGLVAAAATLIRPSWLLFTPLAAVVALCSRSEWRRQALVGAGMLCGLGIGMLPWWVRNWQVTGSFVPTTLQVGESLYDGWNPQATGASDMRFVDRFRQQLREEDATCPPAASAASFEQRLDERMRDAAWTWAQAHPGQVLRLAGVKFLRTWNVWPNEPALRQWPVRLVVLAGYAPLLLAGVGGAWRFARRGWPWRCCVLPALYFTALHMVFVGSIRYRQPAMLALLVLAAGWVASLIWRDE